MRDSYENYIATLYMHIHVYACISVYVCVYVYIYILQFKRSNAIVIKCVTRRTRSSIRSTLSSSKHYRCVAIIYYHTRSLGCRFHASAEGNPRVAIGTIGRQYETNLVVPSLIAQNRQSDTSCASRWIAWHVVAYAPVRISKDGFSVAFAISDPSLGTESRARPRSRVRDHCEDAV